MRGASVSCRRCSDRRTQRMRQCRECGLTVIGCNVFVLDDVQRFDHESLRVVVRAGDVHQTARRDERPLRDGALAQDTLPCKGRNLVRIMVEIAADAVHFDHLRDIARDQAVEESLLLQDLVVGQGAFVGHLQGASDIGLDGRLVGREGEEEVVEAFSFYQGQVRAEEKPVFYLRGNHEIRNAYSLHLRRLLYYMGDKTYGAFNWGDTRFVLLDCGEDKTDEHWVYYGLNDFSGFRDEQTEFLRRELHSKAFRQAGKKVLVHHIPLWGNETDYTPCRELWGDLLKKNPVDVSLNAHTHVYAYHPAGSLGNPCPIVVGGGYELDEATVMMLTRKGDMLKLKVLDTKGHILQELEL